MLKNEQQNEIAMMLCRKGWSLDAAFKWLSEFEDVVEAIYEQGWDMGYYEGCEDTAIVDMGM